jgi:nitroimidazol reductase NimA-like FMN-containing flavoprotein (pyridoxamine 5'-phosphate oxidase superfamily)
MRRKDREVTDKKAIEEIIAKCKTCHVAMVDDEGIPYIVPLSYGYNFVDDDTLELYFHSALEGKKIDILKKNNKVCFEMSFEGEPVFSETPCNSGYYFSSIIGHGEVIFIEDVSEKCDALSSMFKHQSRKDFVFDSSHLENICVYKIVSTDFTGKGKPRPNV